ncbi:MAG: hypothetical protein QM658_01045 [Gordonia sp. (in: high G+C Gram-positive bacteria)]
MNFSLGRIEDVEAQIEKIDARPDAGELLFAAGLLGVIWCQHVVPRPWTIETVAGYVSVIFPQVRSLVACSQSLVFDLVSLGLGVDWAKEPDLEEREDGGRRLDEQVSIALFLSAMDPWDDRRWTLLVEEMRGYANNVS